MMKRIKRNKNEQQYFENMVERLRLAGCSAKGIEIAKKYNVDLISKDMMKQARWNTHDFSLEGWIVALIRTTSNAEKNKFRALIRKRIKELEEYADITKIGVTKAAYADNQIKELQYILDKSKKWHPQL